MAAGVRSANVDDAINAAVLKLQAMPPRYRPDPPVEKLYSYLRTTAQRVAIDQKRNEHNLRRRQSRAASQRIDTETPLQKVLAQEDAAELPRIIEKLTSAVRSLPREQAWLLQQFYFEHKSVAEIAASRMQSRQYVRKKLNSVLETLRQELSHRK
jgi:RNA polymerase sigma factor (sigma-70 family)